MQIYPLKLIPHNTKFDFIKIKNINYVISIILTIISIMAFWTMKLNLGIDFAGGISIEAQTKETPDIVKMREALNKLDIGEVMLQNFGDDKTLSIRVGSKVESQELMKNVEIIKKTLSDNFDYQIDYRKIDFVGPQVGDDLIQSGIKALLLSFLAIMCYIWFRFEWQFGVGVLVSLIHDSIMTLGFMSITQIDFNLSSIAAILTIIGYSVNDSVVIYDRIRENIRKYRTKNISDIVNQSINETLSRTTLTVITVLIANLALIIWGGEALRSFSVTVFFGIVAGTYSSIFVSAPILTLFNLDKFQGKTN